MEHAIPSQLRGQMVLWTMAFGFLVAATIYFSGRLDWQRLKDRETCNHCLSVHRLTGTFSLVCDAAAATALFYLLLLPIGGALCQVSVTPDKVAVSILLLIAAIFVIIGIGAAAQFATQGRRAQPGFIFEVTSSYFTGVRVVGLASATVLLINGRTTEALSGTFANLFGASLGDQLLASIGARSVLHVAVILAFAVTSSVILRWLIPLLMNSRPLLLLKTDRSAGPHLHTARI